MTITEFLEDPQRYDTIGQSPQLPDDIIGTLGENDCIDNSRKAALFRHDLMVEGVIVTLSSGEVVSANAHCWNKTTDGTYYDVTKDYVWTRPDFIEKLQREGCTNVSYVYFVCKEYLPQDANIAKGVLYMHHTYNELIRYILESAENRNF